MEKIKLKQQRTPTNFLSLWDEDIKKFLNDNSIPEQLAKLFISELMLYQKNKEEYNLKYDNDIIYLEEKKEDLNNGIYYLDRIYFSENKDLKYLDYRENATKAYVVRAFVEHKNKGIYIASDNGVGKTSLLIALSNYHYQTNHEKTLFVFWPDFIEKTKRFTDNNVSYINKVKYSKRLIIDDLGQESLTPWSRDDILHPILSYRLEKKLPTYITSNYLQEELEGLYTFKSIESRKTKSIIEKLSVLSEEYILSGKNFRRKNG